MYNLLVSEYFKDHTEGTFEFERNRFLEYTTTTISAQLKPLSKEAIDCIKSWPCIFMQEGRGEETAYVGQILSVEQTETSLKLVVARYESSDTLLNVNLWKIRTELDIQQFEFSRNHWAIKERDLFTALNKLGHFYSTTFISLFDNKPLPAPARSDFISAMKSIADWGHAEIDYLLLEAGVPGLSTERAGLDLHDRTNAIIEFALANPSATTADNSLFSSYIMSKVSARNNSGFIPVFINSTNDIISDQQDGSGKQERSLSNRVFIVHGQNEDVKSSVSTFLSELGLQGIVLHEQPNMGRHLLTKFIEEAELATFAVVLMTDDDVGAIKDSDKFIPRARQNVILELGYFISHLGQDRVCALKSPGLETPSDFDGIVYIPLDKNQEWQQKLKRELIAAKMPVIDKPSEQKIGGIKVVRIKQNIPDQLPRIKSGSALLEVVGGMHSAMFDHDDSCTNQEIKLIASFFQNAQDWGELYDELEADQRIEAAHQLTNAINDLEAKGFFVFGIQEMQVLQGAKGRKSDWPVAILKIVRQNNPSILTKKTG